MISEVKMSGDPVPEIWCNWAARLRIPHKVRDDADALTIRSQNSQNGIFHII